MSEDKRLDFPSARRNGEPIVQALKAALPQHPCNVLEIASGSGQHAMHFSAALPHVHWWPSDMGPDHIASIDAWCDGIKTVHKAQYLDVCSTEWRAGKELENGPKHFEAILNTNMIHISPWEATHGLMQGVSRHLKLGGLLFLYGPFKRNHEHTAPSNAEFDQSLRARNPAWGVRDMGDVASIAGEQGLILKTSIPMPANNFCVIFEQI